MSERLHALKKVLFLAHETSLPSSSHDLEALKLVKELIDEVETAESTPGGVAKLASGVLKGTLGGEVDPVYRYLLLSTAHVSQETAKQLEADSIPGINARSIGDYGWWVVVPYGTPEEVSSCESEAPNDLRHLLQYARNCDCNYLLLDCDGDKSPMLQEFDW